MKTAATRELFAYWDTCRAGRPVPDRADIEPGVIRSILGDTFILDFDPHRGHPFRLAGTRLCAMFGCELRGTSFVELWSDASRRNMAGLIGVAAEEAMGLVAAATARRPEGQSLELEMLVLPLGRHRGMPARLIGVMVALQRPFWLGAHPVAGLSLGLYRHVGPLVDVLGSPRFAAPPEGERSRHGFVVHEGGRRD